MAGLSTLIIEDFADFRRIILSLLQQRSEFQVVLEASDGVEGVRRAEEFHPGLILLDIGLPELKGLTPLDAFAKSPQIPKSCSLAKNLRPK